MVSTVGPLSVRSTARKESARTGGGRTNIFGAASEGSLAVDASPHVRAKRQRTEHVFGVGARGRHARVARGELDPFRDRLDDGRRDPKHTITGGEPLLTPKQPRAGRANLSGTALIDVDGDGHVDEEELAISHALSSSHGVETAADTRKRARRELLQRFIKRNDDRLWAIDPALRGKRECEAVDMLLDQCDSVYDGDFAVMRRNLEHDAGELRQKSSVGVQMTLRPAVTFRVPASMEIEGYETARRQHAATMERALGLKGASPAAEKPLMHRAFARTKGFEPGYGNFSGWAHARARHLGQL